MSLVWTLFLGKKGWALFGLDFKELELVLRVAEVSAKEIIQRVGLNQRSVQNGENLVNS